MKRFEGIKSDLDGNWKNEENGENGKNLKISNFSKKPSKFHRLYYGWAHPYPQWHYKPNHIFRAHFLGDAFEKNNVDSTKSYTEKFSCQTMYKGNFIAIPKCNITGIRTTRGSGDRWRFRRIDEQFLILGKNLVKDLVNRPFCHKNFKDCTEEHIENFNYGTNYGGTSVMYWLMGLARVGTVRFNFKLCHIVQTTQQVRSEIGIFTLSTSKNHCIT